MTKKAKKREKQLNVSMTAQEYKKIKDNAEKAGMSVSAFVKKVCLHAEITFSVEQLGGSQ